MKFLGRLWLGIRRTLLARCAEFQDLHLQVGHLRAERDAATAVLEHRAVQVEALASHVDAQYRARGEREELVSRLRDALEFRDEFLSIAAHELRTPLTALSLDLQATARRAERNATSPGANVVRLMDHVERLRRLVEGLLDVSRVESGRLKLQKETLCLAPVVRGAVLRQRSILHAARCRINLALDESITGLCDPLRIDQVLSNLLTNAAKYGADNPIEITLDRAEGMARIRILDHGMGISAVDLERIFVRYERAVSVRNYGGLGLGLYIARQIVESHGGRIHARSEPGKGAEFTVLLPMRQLQVAQVA